MSVSAELSTFVVVLLAALIPVVPLAVGVIRLWLQVQKNKLRIDNRPTRDQVQEAIDSKAKELGFNGGDTTGHAAGPVTGNRPGDGPGTPG